LKRDPIIIIVAAMVITAMLVFGFHMSRRKSDQARLDGSNLQGKPAPDFALQTLDGKTLRLSDFRGKGVLLNFWATWCVPCKVEMPWFVELQKQYASQGLQVLGVAMDDASAEDIAKFAKELGVNYPIVIGKEAVGDAYGGIPFLPATFYVGRDGKVVDKIYGLKSRSDIEDDIKKSLAQGQISEAQAAKPSQN
jgi:thiol-disulfide isomerase/thioredoxin